MVTKGESGDGSGGGRRINYGEGKCKAVLENLLDV